MNYTQKFNYWLSSDVVDEATKSELLKISDKPEQIEERFYKDLEFGTAGLRGIIGAGTNRMNIYTVRQATQGLANYICARGEEAKSRGVVISYDSRHFSYEFACCSACVLAASGIKTYVFDILHPVPVLSFAVRYLNCYNGIMITASHNPAQYNGYKVYGEDGAQLNVADSDEVFGYINNMDIFADVKSLDIESAKEKGLFNIIGKEVREAYEEEVLKCRKNPDVAQNTAKEIKIVYTPFHGSGLVPVKEVLEKAGYTNVYVVAEQAEPNPDFITVKSPNPEDKEGFYLAIEQGEEIGADVILGTDPDADRLGVLVKNADGSYNVLTGNQTGILLLDYILENTEIKDGDFVVKSIVSTDLTKKISDSYGVKLYDVYTGFKFIAEQMRLHDGIDGRFLFGFEESYGSLPGSYARDKDAVAATLLVCELVAVLKREGKTLTDAVERLYKKYGYIADRTVSLTMEGLDGMQKIKAIMERVENNPFKEIGDTKLSAFRNYNKDERLDYESGKVEKIGYEPQNVMYFEVSGGGYVVVRPSGTEPKIKFYYSIPCESLEAGNKKIDELDAEVKKILL